MTTRSAISVDSGQIEPIADEGSDSATNYFTPVNLGSLGAALPDAYDAAWCGVIGCGYCTC